MESYLEKNMIQFGFSMYIYIYMLSRYIYAYSLKIQSPSQMMSKGCIITSKTKETIRFHETFLSFGDYRSPGYYYLSSYPQKLRSPLPMQLPRFHALEKDTDATVGAPARWHVHRTPQHLKAQGGESSQPGHDGRSL